MLVTDSSSFQHTYDVLWQYRSTGFLVDCESNGLNMWAKENPARMCGIALAPLAAPGNAAYLSFRHAEGPNLPIELLAPLRELLAGTRWLGHHLSFDCKLLWCDGFELPAHLLDSMIAAHCANENEESFSLANLSKAHFGAAETKDVLAEELKKRKLKKKDIWKLPASIAGPYAIGDIQLAYQLHENRLQECRRWRVEAAYHELCVFQLALLRMEIRGILLDMSEIERQRASIEPRLATLSSELVEMSGGINIRSPQQLTKWLGLPKTARPFLEAVLEREPRRDIKALLDYRSLFKADSTYFLPFLERADGNDRLHTNFRVTGTVTGRLSSAEPNLQNVSRDQSNRSYSLKRCFKAPEGKFLLEADYSTIEPRLGAYFSRDTNMVDIFTKGSDYYRPVAQAMFRTKHVTDEQRTDAKRVALGVAYGMGAWKTAVNLGLRHERLESGEYDYCHEQVWAMSPEGELREYDCSQVDAQYCAHAGRGYIKLYYDAVPTLQPFVKSVVATAKRNGYLRYPLSGRVRRLEHGARGDNAHKFFNYLLQGSAADIMRRAVVAIDQAIPASEGALLLSVHDSIIAEVVHGPHAGEVVSEMARLMEATTITHPVPLIAEAKIGPSWGNMTKVAK